MRLRKAVAVLVMVVLGATGVTACDSPKTGKPQNRVSTAPVQTPHSYYVDVPLRGQPGGLCIIELKSSACPEDSKGWEGSSEDNRVNR